MDKLANASHFLDIAGLDTLRAKAQGDEKAALKEVAKQFEGIFVQMLMKSMRDANAVFEADSPFNSQYTKFYEEMRDQQLSIDLSNKGVLGLADLMVQQLSPEDSSMTPASVLGGDKRFAMADPAAFKSPAVQTADLLQTDGAEQTDDLGNTLPARQPAAARPAVSVPFSPLDITDNHQTPMLDDAASAKAQFERVLAGKTPQASGPAELSSIKAVADFAEAPVGAGAESGVRQNARFLDKQDFIRQLLPLANEAAARIGTKPEVLIAQAALETGWGQKVARRADGTAGNNLFNIKADRRWTGDKTVVSTLEFEHGVAVRQKADFRVYDSLAQSFNDFVEFLSSSERYSDALRQAARPAHFIQGLQNAGYATDPQYADKVMRVMQAVVSELKAISIGAN